MDAILRFFVITPQGIVHLNVYLASRHNFNVTAWQR